VKVRNASIVREVPLEERPRERLLAHGSEALSDIELIAVLLRTGRPGVHVMDLAWDVLSTSGGLLGLVGARSGDLRRCGLGPAKAATVLAAVEIGRRLAKAELPESDPMTNPEAVAAYLTMRYRLRDQEVMGALFLNIRNRLIGEAEIFRGTLCRAAAEPREVLKVALQKGAAGIVLFHTHPSGDPAPSREDLDFTRHMAEAARVLGVRLVDHLVIGANGRWESIRKRQPW
jgi:DNA repair protein RadC